MADAPHQDGQAFFEAVQQAIDYGGRGDGVAASFMFDAAAEHVAVLLEDAVDAFRRRSFGTCVVLAITVLE